MASPAKRMAKLLLGAEPRKEEGGEPPETGHPVAGGQPVASGGQPTPQPRAPQPRRGPLGRSAPKILLGGAGEPPSSAAGLPAPSSGERASSSVPSARVDILSSLKQYANVPEIAYQVWKATEGKEYERVSPLEAAARGFAAGFTETVTSIPVVSLLTGPLLRLGAMPEPPTGGAPQTAGTRIPSAVEVAPTLEEKKRVMEALSPPPQLGLYKAGEMAGQFAGAAFGQWLAQKALSRVTATRETRVYAPEKVEVITAQRGDAGAVAWKLGEPTKDITEKWVMGSPAPRITSPEAPYYKVPVGLKEGGAALKVGELPFSLHPSALKLGGGGAEALAALTREGGAAVLKGLPEATLPYAGRQTLSVIFPWEGAAGGAGSGGAAPLARLPPPSGGAAAAVPTGGGGLLSLEKLSALGGATGGVPGATLATVTRAAPLPIFLPVPPSPAQAQRQEAGTETVLRTGEETVLRVTGEETVVRRGDETVLRRDEDTVPRRGDETLPRRSEDTVPRITGEETVVRKPEDTVPVPERKTGGATGGSTAVIPAEQFPTVTIPTEKSPTVVIPKKAQPA